MSLYYDVFNGDADGICALHQLRLSEPRQSVLITGVKRDISLLDRLGDVRDSSITVLDISLDRNRQALQQLLERKNKIFYADHHFSGEIPDSPNLEIHIDPQPQTCTAVIIDTLLNGRYRAWAIVGAFGDNLDETALRLAGAMDLDSGSVENLRETGILLNYNGYGASVEDLFFSPDELYRQVRPFADPLEFHAQSPALATLREGYLEDMNRAGRQQPVRESAHGRIFRLPGEAWARRVAGVYGNALARERPDLAHALIAGNSDNTLRISVRAPLNNRTGADILCRGFITGGGRAAAAGINNLPPEQEESFMNTFMEHFQKT